MRIPVLICVLGALLPAGMASAQAVPAAETVGQLDVKLEITGTCQALSGATLDFGEIYQQNVVHTGNVNIGITCSPNVQWTLKFGNGSNWDATAGRRMIRTSGTEYIPYLLSGNAGMTPILGETEGNWIIGTGTPASGTITIYGQVNAMEAPLPIGIYTDTVLMTLSF